ncbi:hypothetical protein Y1Q_0010627 [Alligator mississippiensis]|uniref:Uncharacterized protein n=1 Tax=Alligator mississippiensis TaxID=8496 RepID=A0A151M6C4_ALLMI|nr:hypothetical protein Y1Q_0010627 [Alligator mississippiensis]
MFPVCTVPRSRGAVSSGGLINLEISPDTFSLTIRQEVPLPHLAPLGPEAVSSQGKFRIVTMTVFYPERIIKNNLKDGQDKQWSGDWI